MNPEEIRQKELRHFFCQIFCAYRFQNLFDQKNLRNFPLF